MNDQDTLVYFLHSKKNPSAKTFNWSDAAYHEFSIPVIDDEEEASSLRLPNSFGYDQFKANIIFYKNSIYMSFLKLREWEIFQQESSNSKFGRFYTNIDLRSEGCVTELVGSLDSLWCNIRPKKAIVANPTHRSAKHGSDEIADTKRVVDKTAVINGNLCYRLDDLFIGNMFHYDDQDLPTVYVCDPMFHTLETVKYDRYFNRSIYSYDSNEVDWIKNNISHSDDYKESLGEILYFALKNPKAHFDQHAMSFYQCLRDMASKLDDQWHLHATDSSLEVIAKARDLETRFESTKGNIETLDRYLMDCQSFVENDLHRIPDTLCSKALKQRYLDAAAHPAERQRLTKR